MLSLEPRTRMISFRLTTEEYSRLREVCFANGIRNLSDMARTALSKLLEEPKKTVQQALEARVAGLENQVHVLSLELKKLAKRS